MKATLYSKDNKGTILEWSIQTINKTDSSSLCISYGQFNGAHTISWEHGIVGKNVGKANETSFQEQAEFQLASRVKAKKRKGYKQLTEEEENRLEGFLLKKQKIDYLKELLPVNKKDLEGHVKPMLAAHYYRSKKPFTDPTGKEWKDRKYYYLLNPHVPKKENEIIAKFPMIGQPKINGVRATLFLNKGKAMLKSRDGLEYTAPSHITDYANINIDLFGEKSDWILDGELFIEGENLQTIQSAVKSYDLNTPRVTFKLFDLAIPDKTNRQRWELISTELKHILGINPYIQPVNAFMVISDKGAQALTDQFIKEGHEGLILRSLDAEYGFGKRRNNMLKLKRTISEDFPIIRIEPQPKRPDLALFICSHKDKEFKVTPTFDEETKALIMLNKQKYIGKKLQTDFYEWTLDEKPLHVIRTVIRDYE